MAGYTRNDTSNNIATGNVINAADLDGEFDALVAAFHASTGHTHDGTAANGAPITKIGPVQDLVISTGAITPKTDNTVDLGSSSFEFKDLYIDGTANIDALVADTADINAGTIDGVVIGGSTTAAGSFTTLTTSSTVTLNGGTANGVLYLNGSKVATSGSALVFDGTNLGVGIASVAAAGTTIHVHGSTDSSLRLTNTTTGTGTSNGFKLQANGPDAYLVNYSNGFMAFYTNASEQMRLTSTGLGIGTSSPSYKLHIGATGNAFSFGSTTSSTAYNAALINNSGGSLYWGVDNSAGTAFNGAAYAGVIGTSNATAFQIFTNNVTRATLDTSGNLGLGVTPSAWQNTRRVFEIGNGALWSAPTGAYTQLYLTNNAYYNGTNYLYKFTGAAAQYVQNAGAHEWLTAPSGTAGNAITFSQAMTLDASGNLVTGGTTLDTGRNITVSGTGATAATAPYFTVNSTAFTGSNGTVFPAGGLLFSAFRDVRNPAYQAGITLDVYNSGGVQALANALIFRINNAQSGDNFANLGNGALPTEVARITSGGDLLVGTTSNVGGERLNVTKSSSANYVIWFENTANASGDQLERLKLGSNCNNTDSYHLICTTGASDRLYVYGNGNVVNSNNSYGTISDAKMKTDIVDAGSQWADIKAIRFRKFKMKDDPSGLLQLGVVAQELEQTSPGLVDEHVDRDADGNDLGTTTKSVKTSILLMKAAKALQEAMARIETLEAKVSALEGN